MSRNAAGQPTPEQWERMKEVTDKRPMRPTYGTAPEPDDYGCEYCLNDGKLNDMGVCPECDAEYSEADDGC